MIIYNILCTGYLLLLFVNTYQVKTFYNLANNNYVFALVLPSTVHQIFKLLRAKILLLSIRNNIYINQRARFNIVKCSIVTGKSAVVLCI